MINKYIKITHTKEKNMYAVIVNETIYKQIASDLINTEIKIEALKMSRYNKKSVRLVHQILLRKSDCSAGSLVKDSVTDKLKKVFIPDKENQIIRHTVDNLLTANSGNITESKYNPIALHKAYLKALEAEPEDYIIYFYERRNNITH